MGAQAKVRLWPIIYLALKLYEAVASGSMSFLGFALRALANPYITLCSKRLSLGGMTVYDLLIEVVQHPLLA